MTPPNLALVLASLTAWSSPASGATPPGWENRYAPLVESADARRILIGDSLFPGAGGETEATPEIQELARGLRNDPRLIYEFVRNNIAYVPIFGTVKGATGALVDGAGNDFDQSALMIALLRESGFSARFIYGRVRYTASQVTQWLGAGSDPDVVGQILGSAGIPATVFINGTGALVRVELDHVWVEVTIGGTDYVFDPSLKLHTLYSGADLDTALDYDQATFLANATSGATIDPNFVHNLNRANIHADLGGLAGNLVSYVHTQLPGAKLEQVVGGKEIIAVRNQPFVTTFPYELGRFFEWTNVPTTYETTLRLQHLGIDQTLASTEIYGKRLTITYNASNQVELRRDGALLATGLSASPGTFNSITLSVNHPYAFGGGTYGDQTFTTSIEAGRTYNVANSWAGTSRAMSEKHKAIVAQMVDDGADPLAEPLLGETLDVMALTWLGEVARSVELADAVVNTHTIQHHTVGFTGQRSSPYIDIPMSLVSVISTEEDDARAQAAFFVQGGIASAMEWGIFDQLQPMSAVSTVKLIDIANAEGAKIFDATSANWGTVEPQLTGYSAGEIAIVESYIFSGFRVILPQDGDIGEEMWNGMGFLAISPSGNSIGHIISGGLSGGEGTEPGDADPGTATELMDTLENLLHELTNEPIDLVTGDYLYDHVDLAVGSGEYPFAFGFRRYYSSAERLRDRALGRGWTHNFAVGVETHSDPFQGLGEDSPIDAAPAIAEIFAAVDILEGTPASATALAVATLAHRWYMDQLIDNVTIVREAQAQWVFRKLPDGTYGGPPGTADELSVEFDSSFQLATKQGVVLDFDPDGKLTTWTDRNGNTVSFGYGGGGELQSVSNGLGRSFTFSYSGSDIASVSDGNGRTVSYEYDGDGNLAGYTDPLVSTTTYAYDQPGRLTQIALPANPLDPIVTNVYDPLGRVETQTDALNNVYQYFFAAGRRAEEETPLSDSRVWHFDRHGQKTLEIDPLLNETQFEYDGEHRLVRVTYPEGNRTEYLYDAKHNPTRVTVLSKPTAPESPVIVERTWDPTYGNVLTTTEQGPTNRVTAFTYDASGNLIQIERPTVNSLTPLLLFTYNTRGQVETYTDPEGTLTRHTWGTNGDLLETVGDDAGLEVTTSSTYDAVGNLTSITDPNGNTTTYIWDAGRRLVQITHPAPFNYATVHNYDENGELTSFARSTGIPQDPWQTITFTYDAAGKLATETDPDGDTIARSYDPRARLQTVTDAELNTTEYEYDAVDRLLRRIDGRGVTVEERTYSPNGLATALEDANGNATLYTWDGLDRLKRVQYPDLTFETFTHDIFGNVTQKRLRSAGVATFTYDLLNRLTAHSLPGPQGSSAQYAYDLNGKLTGLTDATGASSYAYDALGRLTAATYAGLGTVLHEYDALGNRTRLEHPDNYFVTYDYDALNRMTDVVESGTSLLAHYEYDDLSRRVTATFGNGTSTSYAHELDDDLTQVLHQFTATSLPIDYAYDSAGNRTSRSTSSNAAGYTYDSAYQLVEVANSIQLPLQTDYVLDGAGNRATVTSDGLPVSYAANNLNQYSSVGGTPYSYDSLGNLLSDGVSTYDYDAESRIVTAFRGSYRVLFSYDAFGRRHSKRVDTLPGAAFEGAFNNAAKLYVVGPTTRYLYDEASVIAEVDGQGQVTNRFVYGDRIDEPVAMINAFGTFTYHADALGSIVALSDEAGDIVESYEYDSYGAPNHASSIGNPYLFTGRRYDAELGIYDYRARCYDPAIGRFLQSDPSGYADGMNRYGYVHNNPANLTDPTGQWALIDNIIAAGVGAVGGLISQGISDLLTGQLSSAETYAGAVVGGIVSAEVMLHTGNPWLAGAAGGQASALTKQGLENLTNYIATGEWKGFDAGAVVESTVFGGLTSGLLNGVKIDIPGINSGRNSFGAIYKQIMTKLGNGTIQNVSEMTALKMLTYKFLDGLPKRIVSGEIKGLKEQLKSLLENK